MNNPLVRTKTPVVVDLMTGRQAIVYFHCDDFAVNENAPFKDTIGKVTFILLMTELTENNGYRAIPTLAPNPKPCEYKFSTFMNQIAMPLFATPEGFRQRKAEILIQQIDFNSSIYMGLTEANLEIVPQSL